MAYEFKDYKHGQFLAKKFSFQWAENDMRISESITNTNYELSGQILALSFCKTRLVTINSVRSCPHLPWRTSTLAGTTTDERTRKQCWCTRGM